MLMELNIDDKSISQEQIDTYYETLSEEIDLLRLSKTGKPEHYIAPTDSTLLNSSWYDLLIGSSSEIFELFRAKVFDTAKLTPVIERMLQFCNKNSIILDFFSGSATTAHAIMQLNAEDGGNRQFIMIQVQEGVTQKKSKEAYDFLTKEKKTLNICEIGKERIRRAGNKIKKEAGLNAKNLDTGFKVLRVAPSNIKPSKPYTGTDVKELPDWFSGDPLIKDWKPENLIIEVMLKEGFPLNSTIAKLDVYNKEQCASGFFQFM
jgi:adenine-specific DNA-methyltransferase